MKISKLFKLIAVAGLLLMPFAGSAYAEGGIQISPLTFNYEIVPGATQTGSISIKNLEQENLNYILEVELFNKLSDDGAASFMQSESKEGVTTIADWVSFPGGREGVITPGQTVELGFEINVPAGAEPGGHYAAIFAKQLKKDAQGKTQLGVSTRVGSLVLVSVPGEVDKSVAITEFNPKKIVWFGPVDFTAKVSNTGTVHYDSQATIEAKPLLGKTAVIDMGKHTLIPDSARNYNGTWANKYPFGYYKLALSATDGDGKASATKEASVVAIPLVIVIPLILLIIVIIWMTKYFKSHFKFVKNADKNKKE